MHTERYSRSRERGAALATVGIFMIVLVGMAVIGIDVGRLAYTANETQVVADAGAVAYAKTMLDNDVNDTSDSPFVAADQVVGDNWINGRSASQARVEYAVGTFNFNARKFRPGGFPPNAVRATGTATVDNFFAGMFGRTSSSVERFAVAAFGGAGEARPTLPVAIGECYFKRFQHSDNCSDLPKLRQVPDNNDNSCFTSLQPTLANASQMVNILPAECCDGGQCGGGAVPPLLSVGDEINIMNGQTNTILHILSDCIAQLPQKEYVVPIIKCGKCNQVTTVVGFAALRLTSVVDKTGNKGIGIAGLCGTDDQGGAPGGGPNFGLRALALVE